MKYFQTIKARNGLLFWFGCTMLIGGIVCLVLSQLTNLMVAGVNAWIKPMKFYFSLLVFCWTIAWYLPYLNQAVKAKIYSRVIVLTATIEMVIITWQASNGRLSHFNITSPLYATLYTIMGIAITVLVGWTGYINYLFFKLKPIELEASYLWGVRIGILLFVIFSFEGGLMASRLAHTVGAPDGSEGYALVNWSKRYGDLRIAHFFGMHALQLLPLVAYYLFKKPMFTILFGIVYGLTVKMMCWIALQGLPLIPY